MLYYDRSDISKGIDLNKSNKSTICHYWFFKILHAMVVMI